MYAATSEQPIEYDPIECTPVMRPSAECTQRGDRRFRALRMVLGLLLLTSAALKYHQLTTELLPETGILNSRWFVAAVVEFEFALSLWLFAGWHSRALWKVALVCFAVFATVVLYRGWSGAESCGCFGSAASNPWAVLAIDLSALAALWHVRPTRPTDELHAEPGVRGNRWKYAVCVTFLVVSIPAGWAMANLPSSQQIPWDGAIVTDGIIVLEPRQWIGKPFPLMNYCDLGNQLDSGRWAVVLYHHDCPKCQALINRYKVQGRGGAARIALIEIPPFGREAATRSPLLRGRLTDELEWFAVTPVQISLDRGIVVDVAVDSE